jgi:hypothetical protein
MDAEKFGVVRYFRVFYPGLVPNFDQFLILRAIAAEEMYDCRQAA